MRMIFLPKLWTILLCIPVWGILQVGAALACLRLPDRFFAPPVRFFKGYAFERDGQIYELLFKVSSWKHLLPDGAAAWKKRGYLKKNLTDYTVENLDRFLVESARGEATHWLAILPFWIFGFFAPPEVIWLMLGYALVINLPCIIVQRYNRPRIARLRERIQAKAQKR